LFSDVQLWNHPGSSGARLLGKYFIHIFSSLLLVY
jgi:hypothetical protein